MKRPVKLRFSTKIADTLSNTPISDSDKECLMNFFRTIERDGIESKKYTEINTGYFSDVRIYRECGFLITLTTNKIFNVEIVVDITPFES
jgi:hypothetical protein